MAGNKKNVTLYEENGEVHRKVERDLGAGVRSVTSDIVVHPDINEFVKEHPDARIRGYHPETEQELPSPETVILANLPDYLDGVDSIDVLLRMRRMDTRKMAEEMYEERLSELLADHDLVGEEA